MNIFGKTLILLFLAAVILAACTSFRSTPPMSPTDRVETAISTVSPAQAEAQNAIPTASPTLPLLPTVSFFATPGVLATVLLPPITRLPPTPYPTLPSPTPLGTSTPLVFTDPSIPLSERIVYYYAVGQRENPIPEGAVRAGYLLAPTYADQTYTSDTAADLRTALEIVLHDERNRAIPGGLEAEIAEVTFRFGHAKVLLQGEYFLGGAYPEGPLEAHRMQILLTVFANPSVQSAAVTLNEDTIANLGISDSTKTKPADYVFTRAEMERFTIEQAYVTPSPIPPTPTLGPTPTPFVSMDPSLPLPEVPPNAIDLQWITAYGLPGDESVTKLHPTRDGGFILVGNTVVDSPYGAWLLKLRADGLILWQKSLPQVTALDVLETSAGDFILAGDLHWIKLDSQGNLLWQYTFGQPSYHTGPIIRFVEESDGNIVVEAIGSRSVFNAQAELQSFTDYALHWDSQMYPGSIQDRLGETLWAGGGSESTHQFWVGNANRYNGWMKVFPSYPREPIGPPLFIQSTKDRGALVGVRLYAYEGAFDFVISRFSRFGSVRWQKVFSGGASELHAFETRSGDFILAGTVFYYLNSGQADVWILRLDRAGNIRWMKLYGTAGSTSEEQDTIAVIEELSNGDLVFAGQTYGTGTGGQDMWVLKTNAQGEIPNCGLALDFPEWLGKTVDVSPAAETLAFEEISVIEREQRASFEEEQSLFGNATARTYSICAARPSP